VIVGGILWDRIPEWLYLTAQNARSARLTLAGLTVCAIVIAPKVDATAGLFTAAASWAKNNGGGARGGGSDGADGAGNSGGAGSSGGPLVAAVLEAAVQPAAPARWEAPVQPAAERVGSATSSAVGAKQHLRRRVIICRFAINDAGGGCQAGGRN
jgi:hypothetical protein